MRSQRRIADGAALELKHARDDHQAVLHPMVHLFQKNLMAVQRGLEIVLVAVALDRHAEDVRRALQEGEIVLDELVLRPAVDLEHPERPAIALQDDVHRAVDAVLAQDLRRPEALLVLEVVGNHRLAGAQRKPRRGGQIGADAGGADNACVPTDAGADQQFVLGRDVFQHLAELGAQPFGRQARGVGEKRVERRALQRGHAQLGQYFLLPDTLLQCAQREVRGPARRLGLDHRLFLFVRRAHEAAVPTLPSADKRHVRSATRMQGRANDRARFRSRCGADSGAGSRGWKGAETVHFGSCTRWSNS